MARADGDAAIDDHRGAGHEAGGIAGEESHGIGDIIGHSRPRDRLRRARHLQDHRLGLIDQLGRHFHAGGEDVGVDGGVFRVTDGLIDKYGKERVIDSPLAEAGIVGCCTGLAINGIKPVAEIQFSGFSYQAFHQQFKLPDLPFRF